MNRLLIKNRFFLPVMLVGLVSMVTGRVSAQTFTTLYSFSTLDPTNSSNSDGSDPRAGLVLSGNTLYGTTRFGGAYGNGAVFALNTDGTGFTNLHSFTATSFLDANSDGAFPEAGLILSSNTLYGTASYGGSAGNGTVFAVNSDGTGFTNLHSFAAGSGSNPNIHNRDGVFPAAGLILLGNTLYGTAAYGGSAGDGTVFAVNTDGTGFTNLHTFTGFTNNDGQNPFGTLISSGTNLYGTAVYGGSAGNGAVFAVNTDGTGFTNLHSFTGNSTNRDGELPQAGLLLSGDTIFGTTSIGGTFDYGTVFTIKTDGTGYTSIYSFSGGSDGSPSYSGLILSDNKLYGTTPEGGSSMGDASYAGTVFVLNTNGKGFTNLYDFPPISPSAPSIDGARPYAGLILSGNTLYGTAEYGGAFFGGGGTVFSLSLGSVSPTRPKLTIIKAGTNVILTWPTNATGFTLQSTPNLGSSSVWSTNSVLAAVVNGQFTVTNPIAGTGEFYRLSQ